MGKLYPPTVEIRGCQPKKSLGVGRQHKSVESWEESRSWGKPENACFLSAIGNSGSTGSHLSIFFKRSEKSGS